MTSAYDVVVVGAGPAGSAAAFHAARGGRRVLLVDRAALPREKTCGDAVSPRGLAALQRMGVVESLGRRVRGARFVHLSSGADWYEDFQTHEGPGHGCVVRRAELDQRLVVAAQSVGAELVTATVHHLEDGSGKRARRRSVEVGIGGSRVRTRAVVVATGSGPVRPLLPPATAGRSLGWGVAARGYFASSVNTGRELRIFFPVRAAARLFAGYMWAFPAAPHRWNIGVGLFRAPLSAPVSLPTLVQDFARAVGTELGLGEVSPLGRVASAPIAIAPLVRDTPGVLAVGDAAGLANPFTGEGIAAALESGELAGRLLAEDVETADGRYTAELGRLLPGRRPMRRVLRAIYEYPELFLERGADAVSSPTGVLGGAVRRLIWDEVPRDAGTATQLEAPVGVLTMRAVLEAVRAAGSRMRPLFGELLSGIVADPRSGAGWCTAFALSAAPRLRPLAGALDPSVAALLTVLESVTLVVALHRDLLTPAGHPGGGAWGRNTLGLALADTLTARALRRLYAAETRVAVPVAATVRRHLRGAADANPAPQGSGDIASLFLAAAAVVSARPGEALPAWVGAAARRLEEIRSGAQAVPQGGDAVSGVVADTMALVAAWRGAMRVPMPAGA